MKTTLAAAVELPARFWSKVDMLGDCWEWGADRDENDYGKFSVGGRDGGMAGAHCVAYALSVEPVPTGLVVDHLCRNHGCVNPGHLEPVTHAENVRRGIAGEVNGLRQRGITHCPTGHAYDDENTRWSITAAGGWSRTCRRCERTQRTTPEQRERARVRQAEYRARKRAAS